MLWRVVHFSRGAWKLVVGRLRVSKGLRAPSEMYALGGEFERACDTAQADLLLPEHGEGRHIASCCSTVTGSGRNLLVFFVCMEASKRIFRVEVTLPADGAPFELGPARGVLKPTHSHSDLHGDFTRPSVLHALDPSTCVVGTDEGKLATVQFGEPHDSLEVTPMVAVDSTGGYMYAVASSVLGNVFGGATTAASGVVAISACWHTRTGHTVAAVHTDGKVSAWTVAPRVPGRPGRTAHILFEEQINLSGSLVSKGIVRVDPGLNPDSSRILVGVTTDASATAAAQWNVEANQSWTFTGLEAPHEGDGEMLGVNAMALESGAQQTIVFLMRSSNDKLALYYRISGDAWQRGMLEAISDRGNP